MAFGEVANGLTVDEAHELCTQLAALQAHAARVTSRSA